MKTAAILDTAKVIFLSSVVVFCVQFVYAWTAPPVGPPSGNVAGPVTAGTGLTFQTRDSGLGVDGYLNVTDFGSAGYYMSAPKYCLSGNGSETDCITAWPSGGVSDTLAGLSCSDNQIAKWSSTGGAWECQNDKDASDGVASGSFRGMYMRQYPSNRCDPNPVTNDCTCPLGSSPANPVVSNTGSNFQSDRWYFCFQD